VVNLEDLEQRSVIVCAHAFETGFMSESGRSKACQPQNGEEE
jgi:hypothetical protein